MVYISCARCNATCDAQFNPNDHAKTIRCGVFINFSTETFEQFVAGHAAVLGLRQLQVAKPLNNGERSLLDHASADPGSNLSAGQFRDVRRRALSVLNNLYYNSDKTLKFITTYEKIIATYCQPSGMNNIRVYFFITF